VIHGQATAVAVVVAAGAGERLGAAVPKALIPLAGRPLLSHALDRLERSGVIDQVVVVHPPGYEGRFADICRTHGVGTLVPGGVTRTDSVRAGVEAIGPEAARIAVHDAARALTPGDVVARAVAAVEGDVVAAAPGLPIPDTLKRVSGGEVTATLDRSGVWAVHTPQVVRADALRASLAWGRGEAATDDLGLVEQAIAAGKVSGRVVLVDGDVRDLKITYPRDLALAERMLAAEDRAAAPASGGAT